MASVNDSSRLLSVEGTTHNNARRMTPTTYALELRPKIPPSLSRLDELASNLVYSWDRGIRSIFAQLDAELWAACGNNPKLFLRRVAQVALDRAADDGDFLEAYGHAVASLDAYLAATPRPEI